MAIKILLPFILLTSTLIALFSCRVETDFSSPINTTQTLQKALSRKNWKVAGLCFTEEIRTMNQNVLNKKEFYLMETGTVQSLLGPIPILSKDAQFNIEQIDSEKAIVKISYSNFVDKDGRLKHLSLKKTNHSEWKINEILWKRKG